MFIIVIVLVFVLAGIVFAMAEKPDGINGASPMADSKYITSVELSNASITSKSSLDKGSKLVNEEGQAKKALNYLPLFKLKAKQEYEFSGHIIDEYGNAFTKAQTYPLYDEVGSEITYFWHNADQVCNGEYRFYIGVYEQSGDPMHPTKKVATVISDPVKINIPGNDGPPGFYVLSPPLMPDRSGLHTTFSINDKPTIAWVDTINRRVVKYILYHSSIEFYKDLLPIVDNISADKRAVIVDPKLLKDPKLNPTIQDPGPMSTASDSLIVRAVFADGSYKDTEGSEVIEIRDYYLRD
jgi:hypothetical protein